MPIGEGFLRVLGRDRLTKTCINGQNLCKMSRINHVIAGLASLAMTTLISPSPAQAEPEGVLLLGLQYNSKFDSEVRDAIRTRLEQMAVTSAVHGPRLGAEELGCTTPDCLERLGKAYDARWLLGGQIVGADGTYVVNLWLFDRNTQGLRQSKSGCNDCDPEALKDRIAYTAGELFSPERVDSVPIPPVPPQPDPPPVKLPLCPIGYYSFGRGLAVGSSAAILTASLTTALALTIQNGRSYTADDTRTYHLGNAMGLTYGLSTLPAGVLAGSLLWSRSAAAAQSTAQCTPRPPTRWSYHRGQWVGATGALLLGSLVSTITLAALSGNLHYNAQQTFSLGAPAGIFGAATALTAVGFGLSLGL